MRIVALFEKGKHWEHAVPLCKELAEVYEKRLFDYKKLGDILHRQASLFDKIISSSEQTLRLNPEFFRVGFYGTGFPTFLRVIVTMEALKHGSRTHCGLHVDTKLRIKSVM